MKSILFFITSTLFFFPSMGQELTFDSTSYNVGEIPEGDTHYFDFHFKNTGNAPLLISQCSTSCGCTEPACPKEAIQPGESSVVQVGYKTPGRIGVFNKPVTIYSNAVNSTNGTTMIYIKGNVKQKED